MMGNQWLNGISDEADFVRLEVTTAMRASKVIIPVIVDAQEMPLPAELPKEIERLSYMNARQLRSGPAFQDDLEVIIGDLRRERQKLKSVAQRPASILS
jgi:hypothetical protein